MRANVYVDGFNLYYGAVKHTRYKWLDLERLFTRLRPHDEIGTIYYFTAEIKGAHYPNQMNYLSALATLPRVEIVFGKYKLKTVKCTVAACTFTGNRWFQIPEEKRTDVQVALTMLRDAWEGRCDRLIVVSGDSDLVPAVNMVKEMAPEKEVIVYIPARDARRAAAVELRAAADRARTLPNELIRKSQFPPVIPDGSGGIIRKPRAW